MGWTETVGAVTEMEVLSPRLETLVVPKQILARSFISVQYWRWAERETFGSGSLILVMRSSSWLRTEKPRSSRSLRASSIEKAREASMIGSGLETGGGLTSIEESGLGGVFGHLDEPDDERVLSSGEDGGVVDLVGTVMVQDTEDGF